MEEQKNQKNILLTRTAVNKMVLRVSLILVYHINT